MVLAGVPLRLVCPHCEAAQQRSVQRVYRCYYCHKWFRREGRKTVPAEPPRER